MEVFLVTVISRKLRPIEWRNGVRSAINQISAFFQEAAAPGAGRTLNLNAKV